MVKRKHFGSKLKSIRKSRQLSQDEVCANVDFAISKSAYSKIERGASVPKLETLELITDGLGLSYDALYEDYLDIVEDIKDLIEFANIACSMKKLTFGRKVIGKIYRMAKRESDKNKDVIIVTTVFRHIIWKKIYGTPVNKRMADFVVNRFEILHKNHLLELCKEMWEISYKNGKYDIFIDIIKNIIGELNYEKDKLFEIYFWYAIANYYSRRYQEAYDACQKSLSYRDFAPSDDRIAVVLNLYGNICLQKKEYEKARFSYLELIEILDSDFSHTGVIRAYGNIGRSYYLEDDCDNARKYWELVLNKTPKNRYERIYLLTDYTYLELAYGDVNKGVHLLNLTEYLLAYIKSNNSTTSYKTDEILHLRNKAVYSRVKGHISLALDSFFDVLDRLSTLQLKDELVETFYLIADLMGRNGISLSDDKLKKLHEVKKLLI